MTAARPLADSSSDPTVIRARERRGLAGGLVAACIWGGYLAVSRHGIGSGLAASDLAFLRYATAGVLLLPWFLRHSPLTLAGVGWVKGSVLALLAGPGFVLAGASGFLFAPLAHSAVIQLGTLTLMGILLSMALAGERADARRLAGLAVVVFGLVVTAGPGLLDGGSDTWKGDVLFALAGSMWALFTVLQRRWRITPMTATAAVSVLSGLFYTPIYFAWRGIGPLLSAPPLVLTSQAIVLGALAGVAALYAFSLAVDYLGPGRASLFPALAPAVAILIGAPLTGEIPTYWQVLGLVILTAGLLLALHTPRRAKAADDTQTASRL